MRKCVSIALAAALVCALAGGLVQAQDASVVRVLVGFKGPADAGLVTNAGGTVTAAYDIIPAVAATLPAAAADKLAQDPRVAYVEPDRVVYATSEPSPWATAPAPKDDILPWGVDRIDADRVHANGNMGDDVNICILDTGVDMDHYDLACLGGWDFVNNDPNPDDDHGHGTSCAIVAAALDNDTGLIGVAPQAHLYAAKVLNSAGAGYISWIISGINWAAANGCRAMSMGFGSGTSSTALHDACDNAWARGCLLVAMAGDSGNPQGTGDDVCYPARYDSVLAVAATDRNDLRAPWSSTGPAVEVAAPGVNIPISPLTSMSSTALSCSHVLGLAALVWHAHPGYTNQQVRNAIDFTCIDLGVPGRDNLYGYGLIYAPAAVAY